MTYTIDKDSLLPHVDGVRRLARYRAVCRDILNICDEECSSLRAAGASRTGARHAVADGDGGVARFSDKAQETVVVASLGSLPGRVQVIPCSAVVSHGDSARCVGNSNTSAGMS